MVWTMGGRLKNPRYAPVFSPPPTGSDHKYHTGVEVRFRVMGLRSGIRIVVNIRIWDWVIIVIFR